MRLFHGVLIASDCLVILKKSSQNSAPHRYDQVRNNKFGKRLLLDTNPARTVEKPIFRPDDHSLDWSSASTISVHVRRFASLGFPQETENRRDLPCTTRERPGFAKADLDTIILDVLSAYCPAGLFVFVRYTANRT
jgi:hypothetical protein